MYFTECSVPISLALRNPILEWRATLNPASICCSWDYWRTKCLIDNGNKPKNFQKLFTQRLFQTGYSRFYDTSRSQDFSLGWKSIQCSKKNSRKTWQLNEFLPFPLERGTIRSILKVLYYSGKIKDGRQFPSMIFKTQAYIAVLVWRSSTSLVFSLSFSSTFFFSKLTVHWFSWSSASCMISFFSLYIARSILSKVLSRDITQRSFQVAEC